MTQRNPIDLDDNGGHWEPAPFEARVCVWCLALMAAIIGVSIVAGWLWPL